LVPSNTSWWPCIIDNELLSSMANLKYWPSMGVILPQEQYHPHLDDPFLSLTATVWCWKQTALLHHTMMCSYTVFCSMLGGSVSNTSGHTSQYWYCHSLALHFFTSMQMLQAAALAWGSWCFDCLSKQDCKWRTMWHHTQMLQFHHTHVDYSHLCALQGAASTEMTSCNMQMCRWTAKWWSSSLARTQYNFAGQFTSLYLWNKLTASTNFFCSS
jgi:hypothetical protein